MRQCLALLLLVFALPAAAQIYKYTDASGNTAYSNQPPNGTKAETVELPPLNSVETVVPAAPPPLPATQNQTQNQQSAAAYQVLALKDLPQDEALRANNGSFTVGVAIEPRLQPGHLLQLIVDGAPYGQPTNIPRLQVMELDRGEHSLSVQVLENQRSIQQSETVNLTVQRVHVGRP
ncbi:DUF4124 domain-containing protein [Pseudomonas petrae]|uniref:DUF4124 domain-containing protein n=1 Tax=Pseudomonas petrae TaxID=2912190 RepID=A0ABS9I7N3_9PSED|nr:DUF4124 domain-containing protein [Pseudomonas petrae]MCF7534168.1 DUF4124 domain-containing protein [Pseudomonas petrae]MCF7537983.1 DUF4124 domain-containing protein [Pseudomonas petrae]MCF7543374.1 DUF4124 domain-containing protein [Pseudomonas petrae]MCF7555329.1 DUF4124 domain-containing protein [Pseudomonas petrae]